MLMVMYDDANFNRLTKINIILSTYYSTKLIYIYIFMKGCSVLCVCSRLLQQKKSVFYNEQHPSHLIFFITQLKKSDCLNFFTELLMSLR